MVQPYVDVVYIHRYAGLNSPCKWFTVIGIFSREKFMHTLDTVFICFVITGLTDDERTAPRFCSMRFFYHLLDFLNNFVEMIPSKQPIVVDNMVFK